MMLDNSLARAVTGGEFVVTAECLPPRGSSADTLKACASRLGGSVRAIGAPESEDGPRMASLAACAHLKAAGVDPILHLLSRDMNRIALQSTVLGAASLGVTNVLCTVGRHQALTTSGTARGVFDVDSIQMLEIADAIRSEGKLADGQALDAPVELLLGTDTNPFGDPMELQVLALGKAAAMADFVITQPVFDIERFKLWMNLVRERDIHSKTCIIAGVMPLNGKDQASALAEKYRHVLIPEEILGKLEGGRDAGIEIASRTIADLRGIEGVRGIHLMTGEDVELAAAVLQASGLSRS